MNDIIKNSRECRYKGVSLLVDKITSTDGRTNVEYLLANTDRRIVRDGGAFPPEFVVSGTLHSTAQNFREINDRINQLRSILNSPLPGEFVHPIIDGPFYCKHGQYSIDYDTSKIGRCDYRIVLKQCDKNGNPLVPTGLLFSKPQLKKLARAANKSLQDASAAALTHGNPANKLNTKSFLGAISDKLSGSFSSIGGDIAKANAFDDKAFKIKDDAAFYADNPKILFAAISDALFGIDGLTVDTFIKMKKISDLFDFDSGTDTSLSQSAPLRIPSSPETRDEAERTNNADVMRNFMQAGSLIEYIGYVSEIQASTVGDIDRTISEMSTAYEDIRERLESDSSDTESVYPARPDYSETIAAIEAAYSASDSFLRQQRENAPKVITINVSEMPVDVLSYLLYEDSSRSYEIMELNGFIDPFAVIGEVKVLSQ